MAWIRKYAITAEVPDLKKYIGRACKAHNPRKNYQKEVIECEEILGSLAYPTKYQINYKGQPYFIVMLDFHAQMNGEHVTEAEIQAFDQMEHHVEEVKNRSPFLHTARKKLWKPR